MGMAMFMALLGAPLNGVVALALLAVAVLTIGYRFGRRPDWRRSMRGASKATGGTGWVMGTTGGSQSSGGSRSSSSSFGGGSSGGGGASGRW